MICSVRAHAQTPTPTQLLLLLVRNEMGMARWQPGEADGSAEIEENTNKTTDCLSRAIRREQLMALPLMEPLLNVHHE